MAFLTREELPTFPSFPLFLEDDIKTEVLCVQLRTTLEVTEGDIDTLTTFTLRVFQDVFHKTYEWDSKMISYWLTPVVLNGNYLSLDLNPRELIDWTTLQNVQHNEVLVWSTDKPAEFLSDRFAFDGWDGKYRYFTSEVEPTLRPSDKPPSIMPRRRHMDSIMSYCLSLYKNARAKFLSQCNWDTPVVHAEQVRLRRNLLDKMTDKERKVETECYICLEPLKISAVCRTCFLPSASIY
jgi:endoribonuclease Dicer